MQNKKKTKLPKSFGKMPLLPKLHPVLEEIFSKPVDPKETLPKELESPVIDPTCSFYPKGQCDRPDKDIDACWKCGQEVVRDLKNEINELKNKNDWLNKKIRRLNRYK